MVRKGNALNGNSFDIHFIGVCFEIGRTLSFSFLHPQPFRKEGVPCGVELCKYDLNQQQRQNIYNAGWPRLAYI